MKFKVAATGVEYEQEVDHNTTFGQITTLLTKTIKATHIRYVSAGHMLKPDTTVSGAGLDNDSTVYIVVRNDMPSTESFLESSESVQAPVPGYEKIYTGAELRQAMEVSTKIMFYLINRIGTLNPFFLSYLAVNPDQAMEHIDETLNNPEFRFVVKGDDDSTDPIKPYLMHPCGENGYQVDQSNIEYILSQTDLIVTDETKARAKDLYLLHNRDVRKTILGLGVDSLVIGS